ncbi:hypothetical protein NP233_g2791 [Leucocoprinus birnbaumii]|uniref:Serine/threonine-protein phosphatase 2A activator n=1 Tax=Leucocoprinus birnbaumii TaxID=56174 RepID=A0AAD5VXR9_9AGAR|nr:hypothetical protein NP233_g2791 [Leucocoprinus birnbaumii]
MDMDIQLPLPREILPSDFQYLGPPPSLVIKTDSDVENWKHTRSYSDYDLFLRRLNKSVVGVQLPTHEDATPSVSSFSFLLDTLENWIDEIPPLSSPQRFGNLAFRTWGSRLEERADGLLEQLLPPEMRVLVPYVKPYFLTSFGSFTRMDYGTGHETSFALLLLCLTLVRFFQPTPDVERQLVLRVFLRYLRLCWKLQDVYKLEPAGSHGVWGLDDYCFLPYIFGSGQLRGRFYNVHDSINNHKTVDQTTTPPSAILQPPLPTTNLYFLAIMRILDVKRGPFFEHSSQLYSIATGVPNWAKINTGLFKMYRAEVLGKRVVVQHIPLGGLLEWEVSPSDRAPSSGISVPSRASHSTAASGTVAMEFHGHSPNTVYPEGSTWHAPQ